MRVLITWGSKHGGTEGIAQIIGEELSQQGFDVFTTSADKAKDIEAFDAVLIGGALYANRWPSNVRRFVYRYTDKLRKVPVWFFSSGPLDDSAEHETIPATNQVTTLAEWVGAKGHITFGGRLEPNIQGFPASAMAKKMSGDWRNPEHIRAWARELAAVLPSAVPGIPIEHKARSLGRLASYAITGWAVCTIITGALLPISVSIATAAHIIAAPLIFGVLAWYYFRAHGSREPLPTAIGWVALVALLDLVFIAGVAQHSLEMFSSVWGAWVPLLLIFFSAWLVGLMVSMMPLPKSSVKQSHA